MPRCASHKLGLSEYSVATFCTWFPPGPLKTAICGDLSETAEPDLKHGVSFLCVFCWMQMQILGLTFFFLHFRSVFIFLLPFTSYILFHPLLPPFFFTRKRGFVSFFSLTSLSFCFAYFFYSRIFILFSFVLLYHHFYDLSAFPPFPVHLPTIMFS